VALGTLRPHAPGTSGKAWRGRPSRPLAAACAVMNAAAGSYDLGSGAGGGGPTAAGAGFLASRVCDRRRAELRDARSGARAARGTVHALGARLSGRQAARGARRCAGEAGARARPLRRSDGRVWGGAGGLAGAGSNEGGLRMRRLRTRRRRAAARGPGWPLRSRCAALARRRPSARPYPMPPLTPCLATRLGPLLQLTPTMRPLRLPLPLGASPRPTPPLQSAGSQRLPDATSSR